MLNPAPKDDAEPSAYDACLSRCSDNEVENA